MDDWVEEARRAYREAGSVAGDTIGRILRLSDPAERAYAACRVFGKGWVDVIAGSSGGNA